MEWRQVGMTLIGFSWQVLVRQRLHRWKGDCSISFAYQLYKSKAPIRLPTPNQRPVRL